MVNPSLVLGWASHVALEAVLPPASSYDCGRVNPRPECGVLAVCCRPGVYFRRHKFREALAAVTRYRQASFRARNCETDCGPSIDDHTLVAIDFDGLRGSSVRLQCRRCTFVMTGSGGERGPREIAAILPVLRKAEQLHRYGGYLTEAP